MTKITKFTRSQAIDFRTELTNYLKPFLEERGLTVDLGNAKFDDGTLRYVNVEFKVPEIALARNSVMLRNVLMMSGIVMADDTREVFESNEYILTDYRPRASKRPWVAKSKIDGKSYLLTDASARLHFGKK